MVWVLNATKEVDRISEWRKIITICVVLGVLSSAVVISRLYIRFRNRGLASDDWMSALSMVFALIYSVLCIAQTRYGLGLPIRLRPKENLVTYTRINFGGRPFYQLGISFFKIALLISYLRLLSGTDHSKGLVFHLAHSTGYAVITIVADIVVAVLPIPVLWKLEVRMAKKISLIVIFGLGLFTTICSIMRYMQIGRIQDPNDGNSTTLVLWGTIEFNVGNMVSSLPFLAPLFFRKARQYRPKHSDERYDGTPSGRSRSRGFKSSNAYKLKDMSRGRNTAVFSSAANKSRSGSEENILQGSSGIVKSVTYAVESEAGKSSNHSVGSTYT
ncbi:hypothetical protein NM208_g7757 [Fusarium decemcellulare]|uniref:Uncharacterized protein n=1 Tax=Fusarium decemcellulare TaxID=57161 RepID=A0ACC1S7V8_9HYPO|nr:hypothetical protein NM208_g7757 [Fusarium decemcellulare]